MAKTYEMEYKKYKDGVRETCIRRTTMGPNVEDALQKLRDFVSANDPDFDNASIFLNEKHEAIGIWLIVSVVASATPPIIFQVTISRIP